MLKRRLTLIFKVDNPLRMIRQSTPSGLTRGCQRFADKLMRYFNILQHYPGTNEDVCPAQLDSAFADRAPRNFSRRKKTTAQKMAEAPQSLTMY
jgi:hypothetical protein